MKRWDCETEYYRYNGYGKMEEMPEGEYVLYADHAAQLEAAREVLERIIKMNYMHPPASAGWHTVKAAREFLDSIDPAKACKVCGGDKFVVHPVWGVNCQECNPTR